MAPKPVDVPKAYFTALFCEAIMHGIYTMIFAGAMYLLLWKTSWRKRTAFQKALICLTVFMYSLSTVHISLSLRQSLVAFFEEGATNGGLTTFNNPSSFLLITQTSLELVNCLIGDSIVIWRAWVLWGGGWKVLVLPVILLLTGAVTGSILVHTYASSGISATLYNNSVTLWLEIFGTVTFCANFYAICIIGYKAWLHERTMKGLFRRGPGSGSGHGGRFHRTVLIVIESGMIYCVVLLIIVSLISAGNDYGVIVVIDILAHLTGIYPSLILILISAKLSFSDQLQKETTMATMQFNGGSGNVNTNNSSSRQIRGSDSRLFERRTDPDDDLFTDKLPTHSRGKPAVTKNQTFQSIQLPVIPTSSSTSSSRDGDGDGDGEGREFEHVYRRGDLALV